MPQCGALSALGGCAAAGPAWGMGPWAVWPPTVTHPELPRAGRAAAAGVQRAPPPATTGGAARARETRGGETRAAAVR
jgi:hypothetical protein